LLQLLPRRPERGVVGSRPLDAYYGERSIFYNPGRIAPLGTTVASIKDCDGPNDKAANLSRDGVFRFAFQLGRQEYVRRFGAVPPRPERDHAVDLGRFNVTRLGELAPHPVYTWMRWVQILAPTREQYELLNPLLRDSLDVVKAKWCRRKRPPAARASHSTFTSGLSGADREGARDRGWRANHSYPP
jgi:hypothetical protein